MIFLSTSAGKFLFEVTAAIVTILSINNLLQKILAGYGQNGSPDSQRII